MYNYNHLDLKHTRTFAPIQKVVESLFRDDAISRHAPLAFYALIPIDNVTNVTIRLMTDSYHVYHFFSENWKKSEMKLLEPDFTIACLKYSPEIYGQSLANSGVRHIDFERKVVTSFGTEFYSNIKVTVRGVCSFLAKPDTICIHGCAADVNGTGIIIGGASGAGKTTSVSELRKRFQQDLKVINDDWGGVDLARKSAVSTQEPKIHIKYESVRALNPNISVSPETHSFENFTGSGSTGSRLMISPSTVFGIDGTAHRMNLAAFFIIMRHNLDHVFPKKLDRSNIDLIIDGANSPFYNGYERFYDGSLWHIDKEAKELTIDKFERMFDQTDVYLLPNNNMPDELASAIVETLSFS